MRRSFRDAIVGFSLIGGVIVFSGSILWLRGFKMKSNSWKVIAEFQDASGLAVMSPVTYRGIKVGSIKKIKFTPKSVQTEIQINNNSLLLAKPVYAKVVTSSVLGGDAQLALISTGNKANPENKSPLSKTCNKKTTLCNGDFVQGKKLTSLSDLTEGFEEMLNQADDNKIVGILAKSIEQFDNTQKNLDELIYLSRTEIERAKPIITELIFAASHLANILGAIDNPKTLNEVKEMSTATASITRKLDRLSSDMEGLIKDKELMRSLRNITIGLSKLFNELYP